MVLDGSIISQQYFKISILTSFCHQQREQEYSSCAMVINFHSKDLDSSRVNSQYLQSTVAIRCRKLLPPSSFSFLSFSQMLLMEHMDPHSLPDETSHMLLTEFSSPAFQNFVMQSCSSLNKTV